MCDASVLPLVIVTDIAHVILGSILAGATSVSRLKTPLPEALRRSATRANRWTQGQDWSRAAIVTPRRDQSLDASPSGNVIA